jgi:hypothetical protein
MNALLSTPSLRTDRTSKNAAVANREVRRVTSCAALVIVTLFAACAALAASSKQVESTGPMQVARTGHTATLLPDGRVLIVGGVGADGITGSIEIYDRANKTFSTAGDPRWPTTLIA